MDRVELGEKVQKLRAHAALAEGTYMVIHNHL